MIHFAVGQQLKLSCGTVSPVEMVSVVRVVKIVRKGLRT